jgi:hypothetical protein
MRFIRCVGLALFMLSKTMAGQVYTELPDNIDRNAKYVFYSHGFIVEGDDPKPIETRSGWRVYDFPAIKQALADDRYHLIAHHRAKNTDPFEYAYTLNSQVRRLVKKGVNPKNITIMGF